MEKKANKKPLIVYIKPANSSFIINDEKILSKQYQLKPILLNQQGKKWSFGLKITQLFFNLLITSFHKPVIFVSWFADYHAAIMALVGKMTGVQNVIFIGGQEAVSYPELRKGVYRKKIRGTCVKYALRNTNLIIANHKSLLYHENYYYNTENPHIDGIQHYVKGIQTKIEIVFNGIDADRIVRNKDIPKQENMVLTVGTMQHLGDFQNKGFDLFIEASAQNPDLSFTLIGFNRNYLNWVEDNYHVSKLKNLEIIPSFCPQEILNRKYNQAKVFVQASITEGMPNTLSEAMLMECIPVGSNVNGIPDAIGDTGIIIKKREVTELSKAINTALKLSTSREARKRVLQLFSKEKREKELLAIFDEFTNK
jgi:glycosyltransferase involved in cell wall biosynthesis